MAQQPSALRGWTVVLAGTGINLILGMLYAWSVIGKALGAQWHWTKAQTALPFTLSTAMFAFTMVPAGRLQDKLGPRIIALIGGFVFGAGLLTSYLAHSPLAMMVTFGIIGGAGIGLCYSATTPPAIKWFSPARKGLIMGIVVCGVGLAAVYVAPLTQYLLGITSISNTFLIEGAAALVLIFLLSLVLRNPPAGYVPAAVVSANPKAKKPPVARIDLDWLDMLKTRQFYQLWLVMILAASAGLMIIMFAAPIAKEQAGMNWTGFLPVMLLAIFNTLGRFTSGTISDRIGRTNTMILAFLLQALNMFLFAHYTTPNLILFGAAFTGLCYGTIFPLMPAATADFYGTKNLGVNYGLVFTGFGVAGVLGPMVGGKLRDITGSYHTAYIVCAVMLLVGAVLAFTTRTPKAELAEPVKQEETVKV